MPDAPAAPDPVLETLRTTFGFDSFRPNQEAIVRAILQRRDVFALMPTGGGKSLCYQLPALLLDGPTVVISPLIALMKDQVDALDALGAPATFINSSLDAREIARRQSAVARGDVKLIYVAPERLSNPGFLRMLQAAKPVCFAVDEAHCISEWGHDFRPEYRELKQLRQWFPGITLAAFTATATARVQADIVEQLGLQRAHRARGSFNRHNLYYDVRPKQDAFGQLTTYLRAHRKASGIIYCQSRKGTETLAERLSAAGFPAAAYHAGLEADERQQRQEAFIRDDVRIIVATIAFGMGIDKPDVRFVVHYDLPKNLEGYYQESGRAGRDSEPSDCILYYSYGDVSKYGRFIYEKPPAEQLIARQQLKQIADWAANDTCRRWALLAYFDEELQGQEGRCCDVCSRDERAAARPPTDETAPAKLFLETVGRTGQKFGVAHIAQVLRGARTQRLQQWGHDKLPTFAKGAAMSDAEWRDVARELLREGYLRLAEKEYNAAKLTQRGSDVLTKGGSVLLHLPDTPTRRGAPPSGVSKRQWCARYPDPDPEAVPDADLFERLRGLRKRLADERNVPPYVVFSDAVLRAMATRLPTTIEELLAINGIGEHKAQQFGLVFLQEIAAHMAGLRPAPRAAPSRERQPLKPGETRVLTLELFREGRSPAQIATHRQLSLSTIEGHLAEALEQGEPIDVDALLVPARRRVIEAAMAEVGSWPLKPVMERLGDGYTYGELRLVRAVLVRDQGA
ncbi:MAG: DNA helicase RecQ [Dehalococcoidia bacterium]